MRARRSGSSDMLDAGVSGDELHHAPSTVYDHHGFLYCKSARLSGQLRSSTLHVSALQ